jgi:hypothetical protein
MIAELKRRRVFHVGSLYLITAWGASLGAAELFPAFGIPDWGVRAFVITATLGFPIALVLAWAFEITPSGVVLDPGLPKAEQDNDNDNDNEAGGATTWLQGDSIVASWTADGKEMLVEFRNDFVIGRDASANIRIANNKVSRLHAKVNYQDSRWWVVDLSSRNGTRLNGETVSEPTLLQDTNEIRLFDGGDPIVVSIKRSADATVLA